MPCRVNKRRKWTHRLLLEATQHSTNTFVTLTYDEEQVPVNKDNKTTLCPKDTQDWLKRYRKAIEPLKVRFFLVGEYGETTERPHYHAILFGAETCGKGVTDRNVRTGYCCPACARLQDTWSFGSIFQAEVNRETIQYVCGYTLKKMTSKDDGRLQGRYPEFARMSLRPGIGFDALDSIAAALVRHGLEREADVPSALRHGGRMMPLDRYLKTKLRKKLGRDEKAPESVLSQVKEDMQALRQAAEDGQTTVKELIRQTRLPVEKQLIAKQRVYRKAPKL